MDPTPGSVARDSRSLSVEAAQYDAQAHDAEAELRQLEAKVKVIRDKAEQARLAKKETEAAREKAFQAERQERQAAVRNSINDHVLEGLRRFLDNEQKDDVKAAVKRLAVGRATVMTDMVKFHNIVLEELTGHLDDYEFWRSLASRVLEEPELVIVTEKKQGTQSRGFTPAPKYHNLIRSPMSPTPAQNPPRSPTSQYLLTSPKTSSYVQKESLELGSEENVTVNELVESALPEFMKPADSSVAETNFTIGEDILENIGATNEKDAKENITFEVHKEHEVGGIEKTVANTEYRDVVDLSDDDTAPVSQYGFVMDEQVVDANAESTELEQAGDFEAGVEYNTIEQEDATAFGDDVPKSEPRDFADTDSTTKSKHKSLYPDKFAWVNVLHTATTDRRQSTASNDSGFAVPLPPQPTVTPLKKAVTGAQKATPVSKKSSGKRKRQGSEVNESTVSVVVAPANKKGKTKATEADESAETPSKKGKGKAKVDGSVPARVQVFINNTRKLSPQDQAMALVCCSCERAPRPPRLSHCNHMYCEMCWKSAVKSSVGKNPSEVPCELDGCAGHLGRATIVPADLDLLNLQSEVWTEAKAKSTEMTQTGLADGIEKEAEAMEVDEQNNTIDLE